MLAEHAIALSESTHAHAHTHICAASAHLHHTIVADLSRVSTLSGCAKDKFDKDGSGHLDRADLERIVASARDVAADAVGRHIPAAKARRANTVKISPR